ncbi:copper resistance protein CopC [Brevundimonas sp.]|jgi:methionine-rich copper-binding protein CopC|uniref:copper resistance protein CopC n=1 Tax=Brevundimonas sp. TaxID=1871086 RepID=UPI0025BE5F1F|nr:copper resistance protein CopC [Brevundimonas sp.]
MVLRHEADGRRITNEGQAPIVLTAPAEPAAATVSVALPRLAPGTYTTAWAAEGPDGHKMSGSISFMVH